MTERDRLAFIRGQGEEKDLLIKRTKKNLDYSPHVKCFNSKYRLTADKEIGGRKESTGVCNRATSFGAWLKAIFGIKVMQTLQDVTTL